MSTTSSTSSDSSGTENPGPWIAGGMGLLGFGAWTARGEGLHAALAPYGLATEDTKSATSGYGYGSNDPWGRSTGMDQVAETTYGTGHFHINPFGWAVLALFVGFVVALIWCVGAGLAWSRWHSSGGTRAVPKIPVLAAAYAAGFAAFTVVMVLIGRRESVGEHVVVALMAVAVAWATGWAVMMFCVIPAARLRAVQAFAARADQVLGHGHPGAGRVKTPVFSGWDGNDDHSRIWPVALTAVTGSGWQHKPSETAELNRYAREFGWLPFEWRYDPMCKRITGTARPDVAHSTENL
ncbi:hypothetical protein [Mycobacteroides abscessus]|uniref:hypothetical protein n=1 Tax=Mycobacteroides abscessus TaxID=36809 RepID=UPI0009C9FF50|nr:hypothetical protein [Mycobacteroides abscessus]SLF47250.1 Uncharacterised protein [Mycobacteroides abscessus subsp. abscessus]